jgi:hypothetical protein
VNKEKKSSRCDFERVLPQQDYTEGITKIIWTGNAIRDARWTN